MKRKIYITIFILADILFTGVFFGYIQTLDSWLQWILLFALMALTALFCWYVTYRREPLVLTEEELREPVIERQDFSNDGNTWLNSLYALIIILACLSWVWVADATQMRLEGKTWDEIWIHQAHFSQVIFTSVTFWVMMIILIAVLLRTITQNGRNKYIIEGDTLIIQENFLYKTEEEIRIPIACIDEVYTSPKVAMNPSLWLKINGVIRRCYSIRHSIELGKAILRHKHALQHT